MSLKQYKEVLVNPLIKENPITLQILGICSALAVTSNLNIIGLFIWLIRGYNDDQIEEDEFDLSKHSVSPDLNKRELNV